MNFSSLIRQIAIRLPEKIALIEDGSPVSYRQLWQYVENLGSGFLDIGVKSSDKIAIVLPNSKEFIFSFFAILRIKAIAVPIRPTFTVYEIKKIFENCRPRYIIAKADFINMLLHYDRNLLDGKTVILCDPDTKLKEKTETLNFRELIRRRPTVDINKIITNSKEAASINYTYRGYGYSLGAVLTHGNYIHGGVGYIRLVRPELNDRFLLVLPIAHIFTLISCVIVPFLRGATVIIMNNIIPSKIFRAIEEFRINFLVGVPTLYHVLLKNCNGKHDISSLSYGITGGSYMSRELRQDIEKKLHMELLQGYGLTETLPIVCNPKGNHKPGSLGVPGHEVKIRIVDEDENDKKINETGEIIVGGPTVMKGYYGLEKETKEVLKYGWLYTGDLGRLDEDGYLYFEGLKKAIAKVGGNNVDLKEVEEILLSHPDVDRAKVSVNGDSLWGSNINAEITLKQDSEVSEKDLKTFYRGKIANYKIPSRIKLRKHEDCVNIS